MNQSIHIFRKDVRHHWPEILVSVALLAAYAWRVPRDWTIAFDADIGSRLVDSLVSTLVPISWAFLIVRVIQSESLVGDRQFWITRPYQWKSLFAAKVFFVASLIAAPLFILDMLLLARAGFPPLPHLAGLLWMQLLMAMILFLPFAALGSVTSNLTRFLLVILSLLLFFILITSIVSSLVSPYGHVPGADSIPNAIQVIIAFGGLLAALVIQYARRKTLVSRSLLVAMPLFILGVGWVTPQKAIIAHLYPAQIPEGIPQIAFDSAAVPKQKKGDLPMKKYVPVQIPVAVEGLPENSLVDVTARQLQIQTSDGMHWTSGWESGGPDLTSDQDRYVLSSWIEKQFFDKVGTHTANLHLTLLITAFRQEKVTTVTAENYDFPVPGGGLCRLVDSRFSSFLCRFPLRRLSYTRVTAMSDSRCSSKNDDKDKEELLPADKVDKVWTHWEWNPDPGPAEFGISPVSVLPMDFSEYNEDEKKMTRARICQGTPVTFTTYQYVKRGRMELDIAGIKLHDYRLYEESSSSVGGGMTGFFWRFW